jgi:CDP-glucose 4,6-dehydratase
VADTFRALVAGRPVEIRRPASIRPWQHVLEPLAGYLQLAARLRGPQAARFCGPWNFGPDPDDAREVRDVVEGLITGWRSGHWEEAVGANGPAEADVLRLSAALARRELGWRPVWGVDEAVRRTASWYRRFADDPGGARAACVGDIAAFEEAASGESRRHPLDG